jgi:hypothetical protein
MKDNRGNELIIDENARGNNQICIKYVNGFVRPLGNIKGSTFYSKRTNRNFFYKYNGWSISSMILDYLKSKNVTKVQITNSDEKIKYTVELNKFVMLAIPVKHYDYDNQFVLDKIYFKETLLS